MGEHVAFIMKCELKINLPAEVLDIIKYLTTPELLDEEYANPPQHPFFEVEGWETTLWSGGGEIWDPESTLTFDPGNSIYTLKVRSSVKWGDEQLRLFLHWLIPYSKTEGIVGYIHPEYDRRPSRLLFEDGKAYILEPVENTPGLEDLVEVDQAARLRAMLESIAKNNPNIVQAIDAQLQAVSDYPVTQELLNSPAYQDFKQKWLKPPGQ